MGAKFVKIFEKDLFKFIFFPKDLALNKYAYIRRHIKKYINELTILIDLFELSQIKIKSSTLKNIKEKILLKEKKDGKNQE